MTEPTFSQLAAEDDSAPKDWSKPPLEIVREYFPGASDRAAGYILWNMTGWPEYWETNDAEACMRRQLQAAKDDGVTAEEPE